LDEVTYKGNIYIPREERRKKKKRRVAALPQIFIVAAMTVATITVTVVGERWVMAGVRGVGVANGAIRLY
jgi:hypothetical protein